MPGMDDYNPPPQDKAEWPQADNPFALGYHDRWAEAKFIETVKEFQVGSLESREPFGWYLLTYYMDEDP